MKVIYSILFLAGTLFSVTFSASAQGIRVQVQAEGEPLGYAYVFINGDYHAAADSTGTTYIPAAKLQPGDTVSASFVGMENGFSVYMNQSVLPVELRPNTTIDEIIVTARDQSERLFRKYVKKRSSIGWFIRYRGNYSIQLQGNSQTAGSFVYTYFPQKYADYYSLPFFEAIPDSDTTGMSTSIRGIILESLFNSIHSIQLKKRYITTQDMQVKYLGKDGNCHVFLLIKPFLAGRMGEGASFQTILYAHETNREIVSVETNMLFPRGVVMEFTADYAVSGEKDTNTLIYPSRIEGSISGENNNRYFLLENITVERYQGPPIPRKDRTR